MWHVFLKELSQLGRRRLPYLLRVVPCLLAVVWLIDLGPAFGNYRAVPGAMHDLFEAIAFVEILALTAAVLVWTTPAIAEERQRGTLPLLLCTPLAPTAIVAAKVLSRLFLAFVPVIALAGFLSIGLLVGGLSPQHVLRFHLSLGACAVFATALSLWLSARCRTTVGAFFAVVGYGCLLWIVLPSALGFLALKQLIPPQLAHGLLVFYTPWLLWAAADPFLYENMVVSRVGVGLFGGAVAAHFVGGVVLLGLTVRSMVSRDLLWAASAARLASRLLGLMPGALRAGWLQVALRVESLVHGWCRRFFEWVIAGRAVNAMLWRAVLANPYDSEGRLGRLVVFGGALLSVVCLIEPNAPLAFLLLAWLTLLSGVAGCLISPVLGAVMVGAALALAALAQRPQLAQEGIVILAMPALLGVMIAAAVGAARDRSTGMLDQLLVTPLRSANLAMGHFYCAVRAAAPLLVLCGSYAVASLLFCPLAEHDFFGPFHRKVPLPLAGWFWFWCVELLCDGVMVVTLGLVYGLGAASAGRALSLVAATTVAWVCTLWYVTAVPGLVSAGVLLLVATAAIVVGRCARRGSQRVWLMSTGAFWAATVFAAGVLWTLVGGRVGLRAYWYGWHNYWAPLSFNAIIMWDRGGVGFRPVLFTILVHLILAAGTLWAYCYLYANLVERPESSDRLRPVPGGVVLLGPAR